MSYKPGVSGGGSSKYAVALPFSLYYHDIARWLFIVLTFAGLLATGWFGIPLLPKYFVDPTNFDIFADLSTLFSALGTIWGVMAYREFTKAVSEVVEARLAARKLDPMIGEYEYKSYNPSTREYDDGFVPAGPVDFWDKETTVPPWMDKGKYWHILLSLQNPGREIKLHVVRDRDLPFGTGMRNVAVTQRGAGRQQYVVKIPQWLVMNTERQRFTEMDMDSSELSALIADVNKKIVAATNEVTGWERLRVRYPYRFMSFAIYLNKSLPLRIVYRQVISKFPGARERKVDQTNANLANVSDDDLLAAIMELAERKKIPPARVQQLQALAKFLKIAYTRMGLGEGSSEYHNLHHSLEVSYVAIQMLPETFQGFGFGPKDYELMLVAGLLHDYDPGQPMAAEQGKPRGPSVVRTMKEVQRTRILDAYFTMALPEFENYFREFKSITVAPEEYSTTHPDYVKTGWTPTESMVAEALIWRTEFPSFKSVFAQERFASLLSQLNDNGKVKLMAEVLWLADLSVTYMGSDPVRAWDRVNNLYDELYLPKLEAVSRTDAFFGDFADLELFKQLLAQKSFPYIFRQRWNRIYQFFHEGNPSTPLNRTIETARKMYFKVNMELGMRRGEMLQVMASDNWSEYFIGVGKDQNEVMKAKSRLAELDPQNASAFWGDERRLLPSIADRSIDNFLIVMPEGAMPSAPEEWRFATLAKKLVQGGAVKILTDLGGDSARFKEIVTSAEQAGFVLAAESGKTYFPRDWPGPDFKEKPRVVTLALEKVTNA